MTTAAPCCLMNRAFEMKSSTPSLRLIELIIGFPWTHFTPASMTSQSELSIIIGTRAISGSVAMRLRNLVMQLIESSIPSSMFTSMMFAPALTCCNATASPPSKSFPSIRRRKTADPVTFVLSPIIVKFDVGWMAYVSNPAKVVCSWRQWCLKSPPGSFCSTSNRIWPIPSAFSGTSLGRTPLPTSAIARICSGVVPQHPPTIFTNPSSAIS